MLVLAVTHPDPISRNPRALSEGGRQQALFAARRLRELIGKRISLAAVASSPAARCLETAISVARELGETTKDDGTYEGRIHVVEALEQISGAPPKTRGDLKAVLNSLATTKMTEDQAVLLSVHGDLANMLSGLEEFAEEAASGGWFSVRPVVAGLDYAAVGISLRFCEALRAGGWVSCIARPAVVS